MLTVHDRREILAPVFGAFRGVEFRVAGAVESAGLVCEAASSRLRVSCSTPRLWARFDTHTGHDYEVLWPTGPLASLHVLAPITAAEVRAAPSEVDDAWWAHWARWAIDALRESPRSPLREGRWCLERVDLDSDPWRWHSVPAERGRCLGSQGGAFVALAEVDAERADVWRKRGREHPLPPVVSLVHGEGGAAIDFILDGHCRGFEGRGLRLRRVGEANASLDAVAWGHEVRRELENRGENPKASPLLVS
ncbi:MAG: hypothetical protein H6723_19125 [Sandaracinus sp.]|nr:hypothetical protein [Sandaracinus sp.]